MKKTIKIWTYKSLFLLNRLKIIYKNTTQYKSKNLSIVFIEFN